jgi:hypothetical protein
MGTLRINASYNYKSPISIGRKDEKQVTVIEFDLQDWIRTFGSGSVTLTVRRKKDRDPYPVPLQIHDGIAVWNISDTDTEYKGNGEAQLTYYANGKVKKSIIYAIHCKESMEAGGTAPDPYVSWLEVLQQYTADTSGNAQTAQEAQETAVEASQTAVQSAQTAVTSAQTAVTSAQSASQSAQSAERSAELAQQSLEQAGYVWFDVHDEDGELYVAKTDNLDTLNFQIDDETGTLGVITNG